MKKLFFLAIFLLIINQMIFAAPFVAGKDYHIIDAEAPPRQQVQVVEFFNYGCPGCNFVEPSISAWLKVKPAYVTFSRVPLTFETGWETYAKAYYIAKALGIEEKITPALFAAIHGKNGKEYHDLSSIQAITSFFVQHGVQRNIATTAFSGDNVTLSLQVKQGLFLMHQYGVMETPTLVIGKKYRVGMSDAKSPQRLMQIVTFLVKQAHKK